MDPVVLLVAAGVGVVAVAVRVAGRTRASGVPLGWRTAQSTAARLHRRVHRALDAVDRDVRRAAKRGQPVEHYASLVGDLRAYVRTLDDRLVVASRLPLGPRHRALLTIRSRIAEFERAASRIATLALEAGVPDFDGLRRGIGEVHGHLDRIEEARRELRELGGA